LISSIAVMEPAVIQRQMLLKQFTMLKFFLAALSSSKILFYATYVPSSLFHSI
jgi:hypothetical protein